MHEFDEYFDKEDRGKPYLSSGEELEDYFRLVDMIIENLLEQRGVGSENKLFTKGLAITERELTSYYELPPILRRTDFFNPILAMYVKQAFDYIEERVERTGSAVPYLRIQRVIDIFDLNITELIALLLALIGAVDRRYERIFGFLQDDISQKKPTAGLLLTIMKKINQDFEEDEFICSPISEKMSKYFFLPSEEIGLGYTMALNETIKEIALGVLKEPNNNDNCIFLYEESDDIPHFFGEIIDVITRLCWSTEKGHYYIENKDTATAEHILYKAARSTGNKLYIVDVLILLNKKKDEQKRILIDLWLRLKLKGAVLGVKYIENEKIENDEIGYILGMINEWFSEGVLFFYGQESEPTCLSDLSIASISVEHPNVNKRICMWEYFLDNDEQITISDDIELADLADCYELSYGKIKRICELAISSAVLKQSQIITRETLLDSVLKINSANFSSLAENIKARYTWEDLSIEDDQANILHVACDRFKVRNRVAEKWGLKKKNAYGNGVSLLLYGPPGTGKTMAAQVIANELSLPLYRVDISRIFSKYIGETEKNLSAIFDAAKGANVVLFFDEADALFSKRTEIKDSNDKYSNSETAYLLQKIEEYDGMSILATNYFKNFDTAFIRRLTYVAHLDNPNEEQRYLLWTTILPKETEIDESTDFHFLARQFELSGSNIKAILYSSAFMAGTQNEPLSMKYIALAMQYEYKKLGKLINAEEFGLLMGYL